MTLFAYYGLTAPEDEAEASRPEYSEFIMKPMTPQEATAWKRMVGTTAHELRRLLAEGYEREAWRALGYHSWSECLRSLAEEFGFSERHVYQLHSANQTEKLLNHGSDGQNIDDEVGQIPERQLRPLSRLDTDDDKREAWQEAVETAPNGKITAKHVEETVANFQERKNGMGQELQVLLSHDSTEWYTPVKYIDLAKRVMGDIDLDPASSEAAQQIVQALHFFTVEDDGLAQSWVGRVWLNPPYSTTEGKSNQELWSQKLIKEYQLGNVTEAILLVKSALGYNWFEALWDQFPVCFARELIQFIKADGSIAGKAKLGSAFFYLGNNFERFQEIFGDIGRIVTMDGIIYENRPYYD